MRRLSLLLTALVLLLAAPPAALADSGPGGGGGSGSGRGGGDDDPAGDDRRADERSDARAGGACGGNVSARLHAHGNGREIEVEFVLRQARGEGLWRITITQEGRVAWRGRARTHGRRLSVRRRIGDLPGADRIMVRGLGPSGTTCVATATLSVS